jgi:tetratricopeptide (TPR) repeat protein
MTFVLFNRTIASIAAACILSSCAQLSTSAEQSVADEPESNIPKEALTGENLFQLLLAEIATNRRELGAAAALYGEIGDNYNDVNAIERGVALNLSINQYSRVLELSQKWAKLRPEDPDALRTVSLSAVATGQIELAVTTIEQWLSLDSNADVSSILPGANNLSQDQIEYFLNELSRIQNTYEKSPSLYYSRSRLTYATNDAPRALELAETSLSLQDNFQVKLFRFQLLLATGQIQKAKDVIEELDRKFPTNRQVAIQYTRFIYRFEPENLAKLETLHTRFASESAIARTYARAAFDQQSFDSAKAVYQHLLEQGHGDEAHYFLGRIALEEDNADRAADHFEQVKDAPFVSSALAEWVSMGRIQDESRVINSLAAKKEAFPNLAPTFWRLESSYYQLTQQSELAWQTLDNAILIFPTEIQLLYDQAMLATELDRPVVMENNLITIVELDPENTNALNALGYTWADLNKNLNQASTYIEKALSIEPENPAFQDSKGWYLYRVGELDEALIWLKKAYSQMENDEVAAHIAEVLWYLDRPVEAESYLTEVIRLNPNSKYAGKLSDLFNK